MKKLVLALVLLTLGFYSYSQNVVAEHSDLEKFYKTTTCVVLDNDMFSSYNNYIEDAVNNNWTITPYKIISYEEFEKLMTNPAYSFIIKATYYSMSDEDLEFNFATIVLGENGKDFEELTEIASFPLSYSDVDESTYDYKIGTMILFVQNHIKLTYENENLNENNILSHYQKNMPEIGDKTIYFTAEELNIDVNTVQKIKTYYTGNVKIATADEIATIVKNKDNNAIILHLVAPADKNSSEKAFKFLLGVSDGKIYYFDYSDISSNSPGKFLKKDFQKINK
jgi:hypothetical protein